MKPPERDTGPTEVRPLLRPTTGSRETARILDTLPAPHVTLDGSFPPAAPDAERYETRDVLGEGGMGEVRLCRDRRIGREVALKLIRADVSSRGDAVVRFEREARVQGQLEHPSIVPVYDLGVDASGRSFFTMKRVRGRTLREVLQGLADRDPALEAEFNRRRLLVAFSQLCWAIAFAHSRGVVHRDVKPENVMFGDFGEVHLLDWGVATVIEDLRATDQDGGRGVVDASIPDTLKTLAGEMVGTPGYMSPEQIAGDPASLDERADVFALGAVLFELLTLEPLVHGSTVPEIFTKTLAGVDARAAIRAPDRDVPPELELICIRATAPLEKRYASARELRDAVEKYLDGDRDLLQRRALADARIARAEEVIGQAGAGEDARIGALRDLSAAVALDPTQRRAQDLLGKLLIEGPTELPEDARRELDAQRRARRASMRRPLFFVSLVFALAPLSVLWLGVRDWTWFAIISTANLLVPVAGYYAYKRRNDTLSPKLLVGAAMLALSIGSFVLGPLIHTPVHVLAVTIVWVAFAAPGVRRLGIWLGLLALLAPLAVQLLGIVEPTYVFEDREMRVRPVIAWLEPVPTVAFMGGMAILAVLLAGVVVLRRQAVLDRMEERLFLHAWTLGRVVPSEVAITMPRDSERPPAP